jgi:hypothetical protein
MIDEEFLMCLKSEGSHHVPEKPDSKRDDAMLECYRSQAGHD